MSCSKKTPFTALSFLLFVCVAFLPTAQAQKILKVKGTRVIFSLRGLGGVQKGDILKISSDGYEAGKLRVVKKGSRSALGKIIEGSALVGDMVKVDKQQSPSLSDSSSDSDGRSRSSSRSSRGSGAGSGYYGSLGLGLMSFSIIETLNGDFEFDNMTGLNLKFSKIHDRGGWAVSLYYGSTTATFKQKTALNFTNINLDYLKVNFELMKAILAKGFYGKVGAGLATASLSATITGYGDYTLDLTGIDGVIGGGYQYLYQGWLFQLEGELGLSYYMSSKATVNSAGLTADDPGVIGQTVYGILFNVGHKF